MPSPVFYRKWRPQRLDQVVGQGPVTQTLHQAIATGRVAHAYLFCGPRGTGKTSTARILAKAVNCLEPDGSEPCNRCQMCRAVNESRALDLIEIDAASHRGIDDIRNLREKVHFSPSEARYKVYIIDEAHMLTEPAFNALLKTLEEPPAYAIFVLATTEPHKVPLTIISRCQRFDFRRIPQDVVVDRLHRLCGDEGVEVEPEVLGAIARSASGSLRDAENLLEQVVVSYAPPITMEHVRSLFGLEYDEKALEVVHHILNGSVREGLVTINQVASQGCDIRQFHKSVVELLRSALLLKSGAGASLAYPQETLSRLEALADSTPMERILGAVRAFGQLNMRMDSSSPFALELALVETALQPAQAETKQVADVAPHASPSESKGATRPTEAKAKEASSRPPSTSAPKPPTTAGTPTPVGGSQTPSREDSPATVERPATSPGAEEQKETVGAAGAPGKPEDRWGSLVKSLSRCKGKRFNIGALLRDCKVHQVEGERLVLKFAHRSHMERMQEEMDDPQSRKAVKDAVAQALGSPYEIQVNLADDENSSHSRQPAQSHLVKTALAMGATVIDEESDEHDE